MKSTTSNTFALVANDLEPIFSPLFNVKAQELIQNKVGSVLVQWNRQVATNKYNGEEAATLGNFLKRIKISSYDDLFTSNYVREVSQVHYYGWTVDGSKLAEAALNVVNMVNDLANKNYIRGMLAPLTSIKLADGRYVVVSYFAVDQVNLPVVQSMYGKRSFVEGTIPPEFK